MLSDEELLNLFQKNLETEYLGELYARYMHLVYGVCLKYYKDVERAKDAVIEIYEKLQADLPNQQVKNFKSWLYVVTKNHCLMELRKNKSRKIVLTSIDEELTVFMENEVELHPIDREKNSEETAKALEDCIKRLKAEQKQSIRLFYFENKSYREIADELKAEIKKIKSLIQNGKRNLKICLETKNEQ
ncbi:sigma-70 family RNA polymerase sigma factor [uncultured Draconibacterium sp.]|uniref:RNA polymerase sigma factor n=1 Tax=uncultured Draconibacterium sp. TaxID=1573823 RepID=UPI0029C83CE6|nr:sigma-70 family RNA polymerase sigma factor [uncultured Draconibacterium sp.]